jgi:periplasmic protein CpxP/Spy
VLHMIKQTLRAAALAAALSFAVGAAHAAAPDAPPPDAPAAGWQHGPHGHGRHHGGPLELLKHLHDKLNLTAAQEQQYQALLATAKQNREEGRKLHEQLFAQLKAQQDQPIIDFNALHAAQQQAEQQGAQLREQTASAWLAFYNNLSDAQKTTVSSAVKAHFAKMEARRAHFEQQRAKWQAKHAAAAAASAPAAAQ